MADKNKRVLQALERLQVSLKELPSNENPPQCSHWRTLPEAVTAAYSYTSQGAELCKATSTKYTLVGKIDANEGAKLAVRTDSDCCTVSCILSCMSHMLNSSISTMPI